MAARSHHQAPIHGRSAVAAQPARLDLRAVDFFAVQFEHDGYWQALARAILRGTHIRRQLRQFLRTALLAFMQARSGVGERKPHQCLVFRKQREPWLHRKKSQQRHERHVEQQLRSETSELAHGRPPRRTSSDASA